MREAVIVAAVRSAIGKAPKGALKDTLPENILAPVLEEVIKRSTGLNPEEIDDIVCGCSLPEAEQAFIGKISALVAGIPTSVPAFVVNRMCASSLEAIAIGAQKIICGGADVVIGCGIESMSRVYPGTPKDSPTLLEKRPTACYTMGQTAEEVAERFNVSRQRQDEFAMESHIKASKAIAESRFKDQILPLKVKKNIAKEDGTIEVQEFVFDTDEGPRLDTSLEKLAKLKTVFKENGTVTAGTSSQLSDGAAAVMIMSREKAEELGLKPLLIFKSFAVAGVDPEIMGIGPVKAVPKALKLAGLTVDQIDRIELNEAFASQSIYCIEELGFDKEKVNPNGGAIALGHPLGCTGAKLTVQLAYELERIKGRYGMVTMCVSLGMGAAAVFERPQD